MAVAKRHDSEEFVEATERARRVRGLVADQLQELVVEADRMSGPGEVSERVQLVVNARRRLLEARAREEQARIEGMPQAGAIVAQRELRVLLRESVMQLAVACGGWVAAMDLEQGKRGEMA